MGRTSETKNEILRLLAERDMRLVDLYPELKRSSVTVLQHLKELETMGLVKRVNDPHFRNVKYYTLTNEENQATQQTHLIQNRKRPGSGMIIIPIVLIAAISAALFVTVLTGRYALSNQGMLEIIMTNPTGMPHGTSNLTLTYTSMYVHVRERNSSVWMKVNSGGTVDLMDIESAGRIIGHITMPPNSVMNGVVFNISSATITINNATYPVMPNKTEVIATVGNVTVENQTMGLLFDFSPSIAQVNILNKTEYVMNYSAKAMVI